MKRILILICAGTALTLSTFAHTASHTKPVELTLIDTIPSIEIKTVGVFNSLLKQYQSKPDDKAKAEYLETAKSKVADYITNDLKYTLNNWQAVVLRNEPQEHAVCEVELYIQLKSKPNVAKPEFNSFVLKAYVKTSDIYVTNQLEDIRADDIVQISGFIEQYKDFPACESYSAAKDGVLSNPSVYIKLNDIVRLNK